MVIDESIEMLVGATRAQIQNLEDEPLCAHEQELSLYIRSLRREYLRFHRDLSKALTHVVEPEEDNITIVLAISEVTPILLIFEKVIKQFGRGKLFLLQVFTLIFGIITLRNGVLSIWQLFTRSFVREWLHFFTDFLNKIFSA